MWLLLPCCFARPLCVNKKAHADDFISISFSLELSPPFNCRSSFISLLNKSGPNFSEKIRHIRDPKARMGVVWAHCKTKMICEPDDPKKEGADPEAEELKKGHGGCGHVQPQIRKEGLKLFVQYKKNKDDDDVCFEPIFFQDSVRLTFL